MFKEGSNFTLFYVAKYFVIHIFCWSKVWNNAWFIPGFKVITIIVVLTIYKLKYPMRPTVPTCFIVVVLFRLTSLR
jgi:hypothetical protein